MSGRVWPTPGDLADYLVGKRKAKHQFAADRGEGRCCLGHYADMCGLEYQKTQTGFWFDQSMSSVPRAVLPRRHWLVAKNGDGNTVQQRLACLNDHTAGFAKVIAALRELGGAS